MNIFRHELRAFARQTAVWTASLIALAALYFGIYPAVSRAADDFTRMIEAYPAAVRAALGITVDGIASPLGYYSFVFSFLLLCGGIQAMLLGVSVVSKENRGKTSDFLLTKPVSRARVLTAKLLAGGVSLTLSAALYYAAAAALIAWAAGAGYGARRFFLITLTLPVVELVFFCLGAMAAVLLPRLRSVTGLSLGVVFAFFVIGAMAATGKSAAERLLSPFRYFDTGYIIRNSALEPGYLAAAGAVCAAAVLISFAVYLRRDVHAA